ncbi:hypothetical protein DL768_002818 [Monosporascus sp. mg162]|nr:hypothetical protein DL768_002818 [Monosporascus sp. mg162]
MGFLSTLLPRQEGILPYFLIYTGLSAAIHTVVCYTSKPSTALRMFSGPEAPPAHPLLAHTYGVKNIYTSLIRFYGAYYITNPQVYDLTTCTFGGVLFLYVTEVTLNAPAPNDLVHNVHFVEGLIVYGLVTIVILGPDLGIDYNLLGSSSQTPRFVQGHIMATILGREHRVPFGQGLIMRAILGVELGTEYDLLFILIQKLKQLRAGLNGPLLHSAEKALSSFASAGSDEATYYPVSLPECFPPASALISGQHLDLVPGRSSGKSLKGPGSPAFPPAFYSRDLQVAHLTSYLGEFHQM